jgi:nitroreductase
MTSTPPAWQVLRYHEETKHSPQRAARSLGYLDWDSQPNPFRYYEGVTPLLLPLLKSDPEGAHLGLYERSYAPAWDIGLESVAAFLELSLGLSAWKAIPEGNKWALRMNPSSGNLHPTEAHLVLPPLARTSRQSREAQRLLATETEATEGGLFHYNSYLHALEPRAVVPNPFWQRIRGHFQAPGFLIGLSSLYWRESWKYGERALRYCHHDAGHALAAMSMAATLLGWKLTYLSAPSDTDAAAVLGFDRTAWPEHDEEHPDALCFVAPAAYKAIPRILPSDLLSAFAALPIQGKPNALSEKHQEWPIILETAQALKKPRLPETSVRFPTVPELLRHPDPPTSAAALIRQRRSAVAFDGTTSITKAQFFAMLDKTLPRNGLAPFDLELSDPAVHLMIFAHRVTDLSEGIYFLVRNPDDLTDLKRSCARGLLWQPADGPLPLFLLKEGSFQTEAAQASCHQAIAGRGAFSLGMIAKFRPLVEREPWRYKQLFWETGMIGQVLYLEAEAHGLRGTGIGCFFDDAVHEILGVQKQTYQSLYHFTVGGPVEDTRLTTQAAYHHLPRDRQ